MQLSPSNPAWQCDLAVALYKIGDMFKNKGRREAALSYYQEALSTLDGLVRGQGVEGIWLAEKCAVLMSITARLWPPSPPAASRPPIMTGTR